ncbi:MAG TPA: pirin family protein [Ramlibacter sp.]|nr:pirin family protein [Ramlibacter sp.]
MKKVVGVYSAPGTHWVGDGFPVRSMFSYLSHGEQLSPFLLLDYAGPAEFKPGDQRRGVGQHPHRGFETVTIVYQGEVAHRDSTGQGGVIGPGDVQWMTAGAGILHEEFHSEAFTHAGGTLHMVQLWVNLPSKDKMTKPLYQAITDAQIPVVPLPGDAGSVRVIAGEYNGRAGPAHTHTPMHVWDLQLRQGSLCKMALPDGWNTALIVLQGTVTINGSEPAGAAQWAALESEGEAVAIQAMGDARVLLLSGEPLNEPIVGHGPFVMNTEQEIRQAMIDFNSGRFGQIAQADH